MPKLIRLYITQVAWGFVISAVFVGVLLALNVANLRGLIFGSEVGLIALAMIWFMNGIVFAGCAVRLQDHEHGRESPVARVADRPLCTASNRLWPSRTPAQSAEFQGKSGGTAKPTVRCDSRGPVCTGGRRVIRPGPEQSQPPRNCLRPPECYLSQEGQNPPSA